MQHNTRLNPTNITKLMILSIVGLILACAFAVVLPNKLSALSGSQFSAGRIIDDSIFYNKDTMSIVQIQQFLNSKRPTCDTNGEQWHPATNRTRAQHGIANGVPPPYTCLKDYSQAVPAITNGGSDLCTGSISAGTKGAAHIIYDAAQACGINPQVLLVLLQKEQSLITDDWPWPIQYRSATGYGCPDTAPCDAEYYGFFNQVYQAAKAYKRYRANSANYNYRAGRNNTIYFHPGPCQTWSGGTCTKYYGHAYRVGGVIRYGAQYSSQGPSAADITYCGSTSVYIDSQATAGLYIYTPYQPNQSALNNLYGTGDLCSSYGNRNFWRMFNDWFGSTKAMAGVQPSHASHYAKQPCTIGSYGSNLVGRLYQPDHQDYIYTTSRGEACAAIKLGYIWDGIVMQNLTPSGSTKPVYRLANGNHHFYIVDTDERQTLLQNGFRDEGIAFYGYTSSQPNTLPVYELRNGPTSLLTSAGGEGTRFVNSLGYTSHGIAFYTPKMGSKLSVYRLRKHGSNNRLYTVSEQERNSATGFYGYAYEGTARSADTNPSEYTLPVYRIRGSVGYFYTTSRNERDLAIINYGYVSEGIGFYAPVSNLPGAAPIYRSRHHIDQSNRLFTHSLPERNDARTYHGFIDEGIAWYGY